VIGTRRARLLLVIAPLLAPPGAPAQGGGGPSQVGSGEPVQYGISKSRDTVTIGDPFEIRVRVRAPRGARIVFPANPDTAGRVHGRDPRTVVTGDSVNVLDQVARYTVAAWDVGRQRVLFDEIIVRWGGAACGAPGACERRIPLDTISVHVQTVLPPDSASRVPKPARPLWETPGFPWWILALVAAALLVVLWWWWRSRRPRPGPLVVVDPYERAQREFERIEAMGLVDAGERTRFVTLAVEVLRDYLAARHEDAPLALTSRELIAAMRRRNTVPMDALSRLLHEADLAKFAGVGLTDARARAVAAESRAIVERDHAAAQRSAQEAA